MFPLKDDNPTQTKPIVTITLIVVCTFIYLYQFDIANYYFSIFIPNRR